VPRKEIVNPSPRYGPEEPRAAEEISTGVRTFPTGRVAEYRLALIGTASAGLAATNRPKAAITK
jgi:hypothetical protein